jgi:hypothetical protein
LLRFNRLLAITQAGSAATVAKEAIIATRRKAIPRACFKLANRQKTNEFGTSHQPPFKFFSAQMRFTHVGSLEFNLHISEPT